jgi:hypothetical protein
MCCGDRLRSHRDNGPQSADVRFQRSDYRLCIESGHQSRMQNACVNAIQNITRKFSPQAVQVSEIRSLLYDDR